LNDNRLANSVVPRPVSATFRDSLNPQGCGPLCSRRWVNLTVPLMVKLSEEPSVAGKMKTGRKPEIQAIAQR
jgi:hypothetical protein